MKIDKKIEEINEYFKQKVLNGDYEFIKCSSTMCTAEILIDNKYKFELWIANDPKLNFRFYFYNTETTINPKFTNKKDRMKAYRNIKPYIEKYKATILKQEKQKEINRLQKELENLK